jgi:hypothetical protein
MEPQPLPDSKSLSKEADKIRKDIIKAMISEATIVDEDDNGNKRYGGDSLLGLIS